MRLKKVVKEIYKMMLAEHREELTIYNKVRELNGYPAHYVEARKKQVEKLEKAVKHSQEIVNLLT